MRVPLGVPDYVQHPKAIAWIQEMADLCKPDAVHWWIFRRDESQPA